MPAQHNWWFAFGALAGAFVLAATSWRPVVSNVEQPKYTVVESDGDLQIRDYEQMIVAEADVTGTRESAIREGFRTIVDYIFGNNLASQNIAMTAPVIQQRDGHLWHVRFVMPDGYTMETLPKPKNMAIKLKSDFEGSFCGGPVFWQSTARKFAGSC